MDSVDEGGGVRVEDFLTEAEIRGCRQIVHRLKNGHTDLDAAIACSKRCVDDWVTSAVYPTNYEPGNYIALKPNDAVIVLKLKPIDRDVALAYFCLKAKYPGADSQGANEAYLMRRPAHSRMSSHYSTPRS